MRISLKITLPLIIVLILISEAAADIIYLKNGRKIEGVIRQDNSEYLELGVGSGSVKFYHREIARIERSSTSENLGIKEDWDKERRRKEEELALRRQLEKAAEEARPREAKTIKQGDHLIVNALLNKKVNARLLVDTGASIVVLSPAIVKKLNIDVERADIPKVKITLADGREVMSRQFKLKNISVGSADAEDVAASVIFEKDAFKDFDGILGMSFLKLFKFAIDVSGNQIILNKQ